MAYNGTNSDRRTMVRSSSRRLWALLIAATVIAWAGPAAAVGGSWDRNDHVSMRLIAPVEGVGNLRCRHGGAAGSADKPLPGGGKRKGGGAGDGEIGQEFTSSKRRPSKISAGRQFAGAFWRLSGKPACSAAGVVSGEDKLKVPGRFQARGIVGLRKINYDRS